MEASDRQPAPTYQPWKQVPSLVRLSEDWPPSRPPPATSGETPSQHRRATPLPHSWPTETMRITNAYNCFDSSYLGQFVIQQWITNTRAWREVCPPPSGLFLLCAGRGDKECGCHECFSPEPGLRWKEFPEDTPLLMHSFHRYLIC